MTDDKKPADQLLDLVLYAPLGLLSDARMLLPSLAEKGRVRVNNARFLGQMAVQMGQNEAEKRLIKLESHARRSLVEMGLAPPSPPASAAAPAPQPVGSPRSEAQAPVVTPTVARKAVARPKAAASKPKTAATPRPATKPKGTSKPKTAARPKGTSASQTTRPVPTTDSSTPPAVDSLAIPDYDSLAASQVVSRLAGLRGADLDAVRRYELATRGRKTILGRVAQLQSS